MNEPTKQLVALIVVIGIIRYFIINPSVLFLHYKGILEGPINPPFLSMHVRWRNIGVFFAFCAIWALFLWRALPLMLK